MEKVAEGFAAVNNTSDKIHIRAEFRGRIQPDQFPVAQPHRMPGIYFMHLFRNIIYKRIVNLRAHLFLFLRVSFPVNLRAWPGINMPETRIIIFIA